MTRTPAALRRDVLARIEPTPARTREARRLATRLIRDLRRHALARGLHVQPRLVGSLAKDTHLAYPLDVDVFILFPPSTARNALEKQGIALGKAVLRRPVLRYAEHPYVHGRVGDLDVDVVPAYRLRDPTGKLSAVDRTPFHTEFVRKRATARHRREIRLLKRFLRGIGCYGAETAVGGVSGYLAELLVLKHGSFDATLEAVVGWKPPVSLSLGPPAPPMGGPLVFVDPVDPSRNAAAAVQVDTLDRMRRAAKAYRRRPSLDFFFPPERRPFPLERLRRLVATKPTLALETALPEGRPETARPQAQRLASKLARALEEEGFQIVRKDVHDVGDRMLVLLEHGPAQLPPTYEHRGPPERDVENGERFLARWKRDGSVARPPRVRSGRWTVEVRRERRTPAELLGPQLEHLLRGFEFAKGPPPRFLVGDALLEDPRRHAALTVFLRRLDPWRR